MEKRLLLKLELEVPSKSDWPKVKNVEVEIPHSKIKNGVTTEEIVVEEEQVILMRIPAGTNVIELPGLVAFDADNYWAIQKTKSMAWMKELDAQREVLGSTLYELYLDLEGNPLQEVALRLDRKIDAEIL